MIWGIGITTLQSQPLSSLLRRCSRYPDHHLPHHHPHHHHHQNVGPPPTPAKRTISSIDFQLGLDRYPPPPLPVDYESYLVELTSDEDSVNAKAWPLRRRLVCAFILGSDTLVACWRSSSYSAAADPVSVEFGLWCCGVVRVDVVYLWVRYRTASFWSKTLMLNGLV